jgi:hypothetical protein
MSSLMVANDDTMLIADDLPTVGLEPLDDPEPASTTRLETLLFALSLVATLPPTAMLASSRAALPFVQAEPQPVLTAFDLEATIGRPTTEVGRGRIGLGEIDQRMHRLLVSLNVYQVTDGSGVLVCLGVVSPNRVGVVSPNRHGVVRPNRMADGAGGVAPADLWTLAREALALHGVFRETPVEMGDDAFLAVYGGVTAQVAWLTGDHLATASVTSLNGDEAWMIETARSIAGLLDRRLR